ncbi:nucleotidyltransferase [bacterium]|nr:nucleotidyltransferase [bacterium]
MEQLNQDFLEFIGFLEEENVDYLVIGGYAVGLHGFPRYTGDIDFFIAVNDVNSHKVLRVFEKFGFGDIGIVREDFLKVDHVVEIGREPRKIQVLTGIDGVEFEECVRRKVETMIGGRVVKFIGEDDLMRNKAASGRPKDRLDLEELRKL